MNSSNPFSAPSDVAATIVRESSEQDLSFGAIAKRTFLAWEKLRVVYIAILGIETIAFGLIVYPLIIELEFWGGVVVGAILANICFFAGPITETYVAWLGYPTRALRIVMFLTGTAFSSILVVATLRYLMAQ